jgi:hypothetical protein
MPPGKSLIFLFLHCFKLSNCKCSELLHFKLTEILQSLKFNFNSKKYEHLSNHGLFCLKTGASNSVNCSKFTFFKFLKLSVEMTICSPLQFQQIQNIMDTQIIQFGLLYTTHAFLPTHHFMGSLHSNFTYST